jgi:hypothetical protein
MWKVKRTDPWMWPRESHDGPNRTEEQIQVFSSFWKVAAHCLFFVDFYLWDGTGHWSAPPELAGGPEDLPIGEDGAAILPSRAYTREELLRVLDHCRRRARGVLGSLTETQLRRQLPANHPRSGKTFEELLVINLDHLGEHGGQLEAAVQAWARESERRSLS